MVADKEQEPVAWGWRGADGQIRDCIAPDTHAEKAGEYTIPLYTHPPGACKSQPQFTGQGQMFIKEGWYNKEHIAAMHDYLVLHPWGVITPKQKPVAWMLIDSAGGEDDIYYEEPVQSELPEGWSYKPLYTHPPHREWVGLTAEEMMPFCEENLIVYGAFTVDFILAIEAKLKEKNDG